ncbi:MAG: hypothetical protein Q8Q09_27305 [Deltaproteobacteria bacterium]|nr:hypothetical protein [Deltaproteobacteria bacterium]
MKTPSFLLALGSVLVLVACGGPVPNSDAGAGTDAMTAETSTRADSGSADSGRDAMVNSDRCAASDMNAVSTVGCNGFAMGMSAANTPGGTCTGGGEPMPAGTCTTPMTECLADAMMPGVCALTCRGGSTYVTTGGCPSGSRCFGDTTGGFCYRDCDATHPCGAGLMCDGEGSCVPAMAGAKAN